MHFYFYSNYYGGRGGYESDGAYPASEASGNVAADEVTTKSAPSPKKSIARSEEISIDNKNTGGKEQAETVNYQTHLVEAE